MGKLSLIFSSQGREHVDADLVISGSSLGVAQRLVEDDDGSSGITAFLDGPAVPFESRRGRRIDRRLDPPRAFLTVPLRTNIARFK